VTDPRDHHASVQFEYDDQRRARIVSEAVSVECGEIQRETGADERSATTVERRGRVVEIDLTASDLVALRAGLNTWTRLVEVAEQTAQLS
jgi:KEOPS complex subunit Pcc1